MTTHKKLQFRPNINHASPRLASPCVQGYFKWVTICEHFLQKRKGLSKHRVYCVLSVAIIYSSEMNKLCILMTKS